MGATFIIIIYDNYIMSIEYPSFNKIEEYITSTFKYVNKYYSQIKQVYDIITSDQNESDIERNIINIGREIYNNGGPEAISGCVVIMILTNTIMLSERYSEELLKQYQERVERITGLWASIENIET